MYSLTSCVNSTEMNNVYYFLDPLTAFFFLFNLNSKGARSASNTPRQGRAWRGSVASWIILRAISSFLVWQTLPKVIQHNIHILSPCQIEWLIFFPTDRVTDWLIIPYIVISLFIVFFLSSIFSGRFLVTPPASRVIAPEVQVCMYIRATIQQNVACLN